MAHIPVTASCVLLGEYTNKKKDPSKWRAVASA